jgi:hypothetical protein
VAVFLDVVFALPKSVPELDGTVTGTRDDLTVVRTEADRENIGGMADKAAGCETSIQVPEAEGVIPGGGESKLTVRGDDDVRYEVVVAFKDALRVSVRILIASELPDNDSLVLAKYSLGLIKCS